MLTEQLWIEETEPPDVDANAICQATWEGHTVDVLGGGCDVMARSGIDDMGAIRKQPHTRWVAIRHDGRVLKVGPESVVPIIPPELSETPV